MRMKIVVAHNAYRLRGGEDAVVADETALLRSAGHEVVAYGRHNDEVAGTGRLQLARQTLWNPETLASFDTLLATHRPDIVHVHNTMPLISPSVFAACERRGVPVVQTLHNFRLSCPSGTFLRDGAVCEDCRGRRVPWPAVRHACYRGSRAQSAVLGASLVVQRLRRRQAAAAPHRYIALSRFCRDKFIETGLPAERLAIKPNFCADPGPPPAGPRHGVLYAGRLSPEKGIGTLRAAVQRLEGMDGVRLTVAGDGELRPCLQGLPNVDLRGSLGAEALRTALQAHRVLVLPSTWYEGFPRILVEAYACGTPVIASRIGSLAELVEHERTGLLVPPGDPTALAQALRWAGAHPEALAAMGRAARARYLEHYGPERNLQHLLAIYDDTRRAAGG